MSLVILTLRWEMGYRLWFKTPSGVMEAIAEEAGESKTGEHFNVFVLDVEMFAGLPGNLVYMIQDHRYFVSNPNDHETTDPENHRP